eukprot:s1130_g28.t1
MNPVTFRLQSVITRWQMTGRCGEATSSHDHLQEIGAQSLEHIVSGPAFGKSHNHQGNRRRNHALPTQFPVCKFAPETKTDRSSVVSPSRVNLLHHPSRSKLCESNQVLPDDSTTLLMSSRMHFTWRLPQSSASQSDVKRQVEVLITYLFYPFLSFCLKGKGSNVHNKHLQ